jgi:hypothetical protein
MNAVTGLSRPLSYAEGHVSIRIVRCDVDNAKSISSQLYKWTELVF